MFPNYIQGDSKDCGATCLKIIAKHYGKTLNIQTLRNLSELQEKAPILLTLSHSKNVSIEVLSYNLNVIK